MKLIETANGNARTGMFRLTERVPKDAWTRIREHMFYARRDWLGDMDLFCVSPGWYTFQPEKVAAILGCEIVRFQPRRQEELEEMQRIAAENAVRFLLARDREE